MRTISIKVHEGVFFYCHVGVKAKMANIKIYAINCKLSMTKNNIRGQNKQF